MRQTLSFGDGWITVLGPAGPEAPIAASLATIRESPWQEAYESTTGGTLELGPSGRPPTHLTALDGETRIPLTPQLLEFYSSARSWRRSSQLHHVIDPDDFLDHLTEPGNDLQWVITDEFESPAVLVDAEGEGLDPARCALFWVDHLSAVYNRAYFVFDPPQHSRTAGGTRGEPEIWGFENAHFHAPDLRSYLADLAHHAAAAGSEVDPS